MLLVWRYSSLRLFCVAMCRQISIRRVRRFLKPLPLYFVPASVGVVTFFPLLAAEGLGIVLTMVLSTAVTMWVVAVLLDKWLQKRV